MKRTHKQIEVICDNAGCEAKSYDECKGCKKNRKNKKWQTTNTLKKTN